MAQALLSRVQIMTSDPVRLAPASRTAAGGMQIVVGRCGRCGVACLGVPERREWLERLLASHERICPGGSRDGEEWAPAPL